ncbi:lipopolysaccharide assembly protein LapA domain-containing protein [Roseomonas xinghualingensis]|uniref:lipopolysaccharide assembly protein LapA domain-containing protein n=1 Tax=Roseomonas xinghualingensis TaxID=2986475 RepID=UPI0021F1802E|nr:lipopolysaccharide assembly protein LapA domain-containing protein [Roseomonas sp. SXEYE001]MCV4205996.1 lipopolysaccharide assembly protein LapA domain-containing protein [Roseomonas sp. SXEYE001]
MWRWLLIGPLLLVIVLFALSNMQPVSVGLWPFDLTWQTPLALAVLLVSALAFLLGAFVAWTAGMPSRRRMRARARAGEAAQAELNELRAREAKRVEAETLARDQAMYSGTGSRAVRVIG